MLHRKDQARVKEVWYCVAEDKLIDRSDIEKGYEIGTGKYVVVEVGLSPRLRQTVKTLLTVRCKFIVPDPGTDLGWACR